MTKIEQRARFSRRLVRGIEHEAQLRHIVWPQMGHDGAGRIGTNTRPFVESPLDEQHGVSGHRPALPLTHVAKVDAHASSAVDAECTAPQGGERSHAPYYVMQADV